MDEFTGRSVVDGDADGGGRDAGLAERSGVDVAVRGERGAEDEGMSSAARNHVPEQRGEASEEAVEGHARDIGAFEIDSEERCGEAETGEFLREDGVGSAGLAGPLAVTSGLLATSARRRGC